jgi:septal ring factor EnvC (AmiA/AmiB activator)
MMTRGQVAKRLGKSVATVRRMEGRELHPSRDRNGVFQFDPAEVERVAQGRGDHTGAHARRSSWLNDTIGDRAAGDDDDEDEIEPPSALAFEERAPESALAREHEERERRQRDADDRVRAAEQRVNELRHEAEVLEFVAAQRELVEVLDSCSERELRVLMRDPEFAALVEALSEHD